MSTVAIINQKGGVGKTTLCTNLAAALAAKKKDVLVVDLDPQANLSTHLGCSPDDLKWTLYNAIVQRPEKVFQNNNPIQEIIQYTNVERLTLVPSNLELSSAEIEMASMMGRESILRDLIEPVEQEYDYILIDCPPTLGLLSMNGLSAAQHLLVPFQTEYFALKGIQQLLGVVELVKKRRINRELQIAGFVGGLYDQRKSLHHRVIKEMRETFGKQVFNTVIHNSVALAESPSHGQTIFEYAPKNKGAAEYEALATEFLKRVKP